MENIIIILLLPAIVGAAVGYIIYAKRKGQKCIGCPHGKNCNGNCK